MNKALKLQFAIAMVGLLFVGCGSSEKKQEKKPATVSVVEIKQENVPFNIKYTGITEAYQFTQLRARVDGYLLGQEYKDGAVVKQGARLVQIDPAPYKVAVDNATAKLQSAQAAFLIAKQNFDRISPLYEKKAATKQDYDTAVATLDTSKAEVTAASANLEQARLNLSYCDITTPFDAVADKIYQYKGSYVSPSKDSLLTTVYQINPIRVNFEISEADYEAITTNAGSVNILGRPVKILFSTGKEYEKTGKIDFVSPAINEKTGTRTMRVVVENPNGKLTPGQYLGMIFTDINLNGVTLVPQESILQGEHGYMVYKVTSPTTAVQQQVTPSRWIGDRVIIKDGIKVGDKIVKSGIEKIGVDGKIVVAH